MKSFRSTRSIYYERFTTCTTTWVTLNTTRAVGATTPRPQRPFPLTALDYNKLRNCALCDGLREGAQPRSQRDRTSWSVTRRRIHGLAWANALNPTGDVCVRSRSRGRHASCSGHSNVFTGRSTGRQARARARLGALEGITLGAAPSHSILSRSKK